MQVYLSFGNGSCCFFPGELRTRKVRIIRVVDRGNLHMCKQWLWWLKGKQRLLHGNTQLSDDRRSARSCTRDKLVNEGNSKRKRLQATFEVSWEPGSSFSPPVEHTTSATMLSDIKVFSISESNNKRLCPLLLQVHVAVISINRLNHGPCLCFIPPLFINR
nr:uncharacterized protein LOC109782115 isoform X1 [Aegilops tauschii subsp. strangulata]XP_045085082.1 uncharacterized protein LOC109782115 isoform X1 [Aegilops tauschii subsp. strangulata]